MKSLRIIIKWWKNKIFLCVSYFSGFEVIVSILIVRKVWKKLLKFVLNVK